MQPAQISELQDRADRVRRNVLEAIHRVGTGHEGTSLSAIDLLVLLYFRVVRVDPRRPRDPNRDRVLLSKGHGAPALYGVLAEAGYLPAAELHSLRQVGSRLQGHPNSNVLPGVDACTGSLGQGISQALGMALGIGLRGGESRVFCIVGDGELQEGQNWEAAMAAASYGVRNLTVIVDRNGLQSDGPTEDVLALGDLEAKWKAFGWGAFTVSGHDFEEMEQALATADRYEGPAVLIADTVKGKGVSYMEGIVEWHHKPMTDNDLTQALLELGQ
jgi:transketolase